MGLSAPRKRRMKLSHDPNNNHWGNSTTSFGHKIMTAQGWSAGQFLGAKDAPHAKHHSAASASHIRVALRQDNLGLGAKIGGKNAEDDCTGLSAYRNILGRLNGKSETVLQSEEKARTDIKRQLYVQNRWATMNFISGGVLVGTHKENQADNSEASEAEHQQELSVDSKKSTKSKIRTKDRKKRRKTLPSTSADKTESEEKSMRETAAAAQDEPQARLESKEDKARRKAASKAQKRAEKESRELNKKEKSSEKVDDVEVGEERTSSPVDSETITCMEEQISLAKLDEQRKPTDVLPPRRYHPSKARAMKQKRLAIVDSKAMKEILMVKA